MKALPDKLCTIDGVLCMKDGSGVQDYLRSVPHMGTNPAIVLIGRVELEKLKSNSDQYRREYGMHLDKRFALAS